VFCSCWTGYYGQLGQVTVGLASLVVGSSLVRLVLLPLLAGLSRGRPIFYRSLFEPLDDRVGSSGLLVLVPLGTLGLLSPSATGRPR